MDVFRTIPGLISYAGVTGILDCYLIQEKLSGGWPLQKHLTSLLTVLCRLVSSYSFLTLVSCLFMASFRITSNPPLLLLKSTIFPSLTSRRSRASVIRAIPSTVSVGGGKQNSKAVPLSYRMSERFKTELI